GDNVLWAYRGNTDGNQYDEYIYKDEKLEKSAGKNSQKTFNIETFENAMDRSGYNFEIQDTQQDFIPATRKRMIIDNEAIDIYLFDDNIEMEKEANHISRDGSSYNSGSQSVKINWVSFPHFYKKGSLIVQYIGEDEKIISALEDILGKQFAGISQLEDMNE
ncbi:MAG: hypothetical protein AAGU75_17715, partial [Bacillota bacterium]